ncbi:hypothetical protein [Polynucleobacter sp.]|uniref:hypothetical protein n=1 Tax=Polynucleobacter sp. TaxID=2029855 RepID=UPI003F69E682
MKIEPENLKNYVGKKIRWSTWDKDTYFILTAVGEHRVLLKDANGYESATDIGYPSADIFWETYEEPKQKVKKWQALVILSNGQHSSTNAFYKSVDNYDSFDGHVGKFIKLLPHTEIEVDL